MEAQPPPHGSEAQSLLSDKERTPPMPTPPTTLKTLRDVVKAMAVLTETAGMAALCSALTVKIRADCVNLALADALASVSLDVGMAAQATKMTVQKNTDLAVFIEAGTALFGAQAASSVSLAYPCSFFSFRRLLSSSSPSSFFAVWLWWPLAWLYHLLLGPVAGRSPIARNIPYCSLHSLWTAMLKAVETAAAAAETAINVHETRPASTMTTTEIKIRLHVPVSAPLDEPDEKMITQTQKGVDANDIFCLHTASALAFAAASAGRSMASGALGASNPAQARRVMAAVRRATVAAVQAKMATVSLARLVMAADPNHPDLDPSDRRRGGSADQAQDAEDIKRFDLWSKTMAYFTSPSTTPMDISDLARRGDLFTILNNFTDLISTTAYVGYIPAQIESMFGQELLVVTNAVDRTAQEAGNN